MTKNLYEKSKEILNIFLENKIINYSKYRNYDYGKDNPHKVVSGLSPYISHGIINELAVGKI